VQNYTVLFEAFKSFMNIEFPVIEREQLLKLRSVIFSCENFLALTLNDRYQLLDGVLYEKVVTLFLVYLYNYECDLFRDNSLIIHSTLYTGKPKDVISKMIDNIMSYELTRLNHLLFHSKHYETISEIGFEKYFFDMKSMLLTEYVKVEDTTLDECLQYFGKSFSKIVQGRLNPRLHNELFNCLMVMYQMSYKNEKMLFPFFKMLQAGFKIRDNMLYDGCVIDKAIHVNNNFKGDLFHLMLHEMYHLVHSFEERYDDVELALLKFGISKSDISRSWSTAKENIINYQVRLYWSSLYTSENIPKLSTIIMDNVLLNLKNIHNKGKFIWK